MKFKANSVSKLTNDKGELIIQFVVSDDKTSVIYGYTQLKEMAELSVEVKKYRKQRSINANAYMWKLLYEIGAVVNRSKDDIYIEMLERYGKFTHIIVKENAVDKFKLQWKYVKELGNMEINGTKGVQFQCYFGSSTYDSKEFSVLLDGIINEAKDLDIETIDEKERKEMLESYEANQ